MFVFLSSCRRSPQLRAGGRPGKSGYSRCGTGLYVLSSFLCGARYFVLSAVRFQLGTSPPARDCGLRRFSISFLAFAFWSRPPATMVVCGRVLMLVSLVFAPVFSFNSPFFVSPPRHADGTREGFEGGLSCHSAFFGGLSCYSAFFGGLSCHIAFFVSPPRHSGGTRQVFDGWFALL